MIGSKNSILGDIYVQQYHSDRKFVRAMFYLFTRIEYYGLILLASIPVFMVLSMVLGQVAGVFLAAYSLIVVSFLFGDKFISETYEKWLDSDHTAADIRRELSLRWLHSLDSRIGVSKHDG